LRNAGFLAAVDDGQQSYVLARDPRAILLAEVDALLEVGLVPAGCDPRVKTWLAESARQRDGRPQRLSDVLGEPEA
jgi:DNA-binding IscR family transcriptional regulator